MTKSEYDKAMRAYKIKSNVNCTAHQLRHEFATLCYDAELEAKDAQQIMGHSKESVTRDIYTHIREKRKKDAVKKLNNFIEYGNAYGPKSEDAATASDI